MHRDIMLSLSFGYNPKKIIHLSMLRKASKNFPNVSQVLQCSFYMSRIYHSDIFLRKKNKQMKIEQFYFLPSFLAEGELYMLSYIQ